MKKRFELRIEGETAWREGTRKEMHVVVFQPGDPATICTIHRDIEPFMRKVDEWPLKAVGTGVRKHGDWYNFETGCRMALRSALRKIEDKELRSKIWKLYFEKFPIQKRQNPRELARMVAQRELETIPF